MDWGLVGLVNVIVGGAAFVAAITGFGFALISTPFLVLLMAPQQAVPLMMLCWLPLAALLLRDSYKLASFRRYGPLALAVCCGTPLGVWLLTHADALTARRLIGGITLAAAASLWLKPGRPLRHERPIALVAGLVAGISGGLSGISGPPVVLLGLKQRWEHRGFRADLIHLFTCNFLLALLLFGRGELFDWQLGRLALAAVGGIVAGYAGGTYARRFVSQEHFRRLAVGLVTVGGCIALILH